MIFFYLAFLIQLVYTLLPSKPHKYPLYEGFMLGFLGGIIALNWLDFPPPF